MMHHAVRSQIGGEQADHYQMYNSRNSFKTKKEQRNMGGHIASEYRAKQK